MALNNSEVVTVVVFYVCLLVFFVLLYTVISRFIVIVRHASVVIIERFGKYRTTLKPGLHFIIPFVDCPRTIHWRSMQQGSAFSPSLSMVSEQMTMVDLREHVMDFGRQHVITKDTVLLDIDALVVRFCL